MLEKTHDTAHSPDDIPYQLLKHLQKSLLQTHLGNRQLIIHLENS